MKYYYLLNGKIMSANEKMPIRINFRTDTFKYVYDTWLNSLQPCEISESEFDKICKYFKYWLSETPIEVTNIVSDNNGVISFKQPKQVKEIEAVAGYLAFNNHGVISGVYRSFERLKEDYPKSGYYKLTTYFTKY